MKTNKILSLATASALVIGASSSFSGELTIEHVSKDTSGVCQPKANGPAIFASEIFFSGVPITFLPFTCDLTFVGADDLDNSGANGPIWDGSYDDGYFYATYHFTEATLGMEPFYIQFTLNEGAEFGQDISLSSGTDLDFVAHPRGSHSEVSKMSGGNQGDTEVTFHITPVDSYTDLDTLFLRFNMQNLDVLKTPGEEIRLGAKVYDANNQEFDSSTDPVLVATAIKTIKVNIDSVSEIAQIDSSNECKTFIGNMPAVISPTQVKLGSIFIGQNSSSGLNVLNADMTELKFEQDIIPIIDKGFLTVINGTFSASITPPGKVFLDLNKDGLFTFGTDILAGPITPLFEDQVEWILSFTDLMKLYTSSGADIIIETDGNTIIQGQLNSAKAFFSMNYIFEGLRDMFLYDLLHVHGCPPCCPPSSPPPPPQSSSHTLPLQPLPSTMNLTIGFSGTGHGHVTTAPSGINCDSNQLKCSYSYETATWIRLIPTAAADSKFTGWSGWQSDCDDGEVFMSGLRSCTANFQLLRFPLTVTTTGQGKIKSDPVGIDCSQCARDFDISTKVMLMAVPEEGWQLKEWSGDCDENGQVVIDKGKKCQAFFSPFTVNIDINTFKVEVGSVATFKGHLAEDDTISKVLQWDFGDGTTTNTLATTHVYNSVGSYPVTLSITNDKGGTGKKTVQVEVVPSDTISGDWDARIELTRKVFISPTSTQRMAEQILREQIENPTLTYEDIMKTRSRIYINDYVNTHFDLLRLNHLARKTLTEIVYHKVPGATARLFSTISLKPVDKLMVNYDKTTGTLGSLYNTTDYLTSPKTGEEPEQIALNYINTHLDLLKLNVADLTDMKLISSVYTEVTGATHLYWQQVYQGLPLYGAQLHINVNRDGKIISVNNSFIPAVSSGAKTSQPAISAGEAVMKAMQHLGIQMSAFPKEFQAPTGIMQETVLDNVGITLEPIQASLMWLPIQRGDIRLVWNFLIHTLDEEHVYDMNMDAISGEVLIRFDQVDRNSYKVYPRPLESPIHNPNYSPQQIYPNDDRSTMIDPASSSASPYGWHDTNGKQGEEYTITRGNNAYVYYMSETGEKISPDCGTNLNCDFSINFQNQPSEYVEASAVNAFYWTNIIHDIMYEYGFDTAAGNFQEINYDGKGDGKDAVQVIVQEKKTGNPKKKLGCEGSGSFTKHNEGSSPIMRLKTCESERTDPTDPKKKIISFRDAALDSSSIVHEYGHGISNRLVGGGIEGNLEGFQTPKEGISDWLALVFTHDGNVITEARGSYYWGLFRADSVYPKYSVDPNVQILRKKQDGTALPLQTSDISYETLQSMSEVHDVGFVWTQILWNVYWALIKKHGFDLNLYDAKGNNGNQRMLLYVIEGLKNTTSEPVFTDTRDGIIQAARDNHEGEDVCLIWQVFAKFGLGTDAVSGTTSNTEVKNGSKMPDECASSTNVCASPTITSNGNGNWSVGTTWNTGTVPGTKDQVLIKNGHVVTVDNVVRINKLCIEKGAELRASQNLSVYANYFYEKDTPSPGISGEIHNYGKILGRDGQNANGSSIPDGEKGGDVNLRTDYFINYESGEVIAGRGGDDISYTDESPAKGGDGGKVYIWSNVTLENRGKIGPAPMRQELVKTHYSPCQKNNDEYYYYVPEDLDRVGGNGGLGSKWNGVFSDEGVPKQAAHGEAWGGHGGSTLVYSFDVKNSGYIGSGYGGDAHRYDCTSKYDSGAGGMIDVKPIPKLLYNGTVTGLGRINGGGKGNIWIEPSILMGGQDVQIHNARNITIFGGDESTLILRNLRNEAISATDTITLAVGQEGVVDFRGNTGKVLKAGIRARIFADTVLLDEGVNLQDLIDTPSIETYPNKILYHVTLIAPGEEGGTAGETLPLHITLSNGGPTVDTYTLTVTDSAGWSLGSLPGTITVEGLQLTELQLNVTLPSTLEASDIITLTATSQQDPSVSATTDITVTVEDPILSPPLDQGLSGAVFDSTGAPIAGATLTSGNEIFTTDEEGHWQMESSTAPTSGTLHDAQGNPLAGAILQLGDQTLTTDANGHWELTQPNVTENANPDDTTAADSFSLLPPQTPACYASGLIDWVCNANGQQLTDLTVGPNGMIAYGTLVGTLTNQGWVSNLMLESNSRLTGGIVTGYIINYGKMADFEFRGAGIEGGTLAGKISNTSQIDGYFRDVQLAANAHLSGGNLQGDIRGDYSAPALLENVTIKSGSFIAGVKLGDGVIVEDNVTCGDDVQAPAGVCQSALSSESERQNFPDLGATASTKNGAIVATNADIRGGLAVNSAPFESPATVTLADKVTIQGQIQVDPAQVGQAGEVVVYVEYTPIGANEPIYVMLNENGKPVEWDNNLAHLAPFQVIPKLAELIDVLMYQGQLPVTGTLKIGLGYRLADGLVVHNLEPIEVNISQ